MIGVLLVAEGLAMGVLGEPLLATVWITYGLVRATLDALVAQPLIDPHTRVHLLGDETP